MSSVSNSTYNTVESPIKSQVEEENAMEAGLKKVMHEISNLVKSWKSACILATKNKDTFLQFSWDMNLSSKKNEGNGKVDKFLWDSNQMGSDTEASHAPFKQRTKNPQRTISLGNVMYEPHGNLHGKNANNATGLSLHSAQEEWHD